MTTTAAYSACLLCGRPCDSATGCCADTTDCRLSSMRCSAAYCRVTGQPLPPKPPTQRVAELRVALTRPGLSPRRRTLAALRYRALLAFGCWTVEQVARRAAWLEAGAARQGARPPWPGVGQFVRYWRREMKRYGAGFCERAFRAWAARYRQGGLAALCEDRRGCGRRNKRAACDPALLDDFARGLARGQWPSRRAGYRAIAAQARAEGRAWPSERTVCKRLIALCATLAGNLHLITGASAN